VLKTCKLFSFGIAAATASLCLGAPQSLASGGDAPWCIISDEGNLRCYYASSQACLQEIASGNRGFCTQNPAGSSAGTAATPEPRTSRRKNK
jgi:Protein of unknown function (DUF3551)